MTRYIHRSRVLHHNRVLGGVCTCGNPDGGRCEPWCGTEVVEHPADFTVCCGADKRCSNCPEVRRAAA